MDGNEEPSGRQLRVIPYLLGAPPIEERRKRARVSKGAVYEWLKDDAFKDELRRRQEELTDGQYRNLQLGYAESLAFQRVSIIPLVFRNQNSIFSKVFTHIRELFNYSRCIRQCSGFKKLGTRGKFLGRIF